MEREIPKKWKCKEAIMYKIIHYTVKILFLSDNVSLLQNSTNSYLKVFH